MVSLKIQMMIMTKNYKIITEFIKDMSSETPDIESYMFVKENISKYHLDIDIKSKTIKDKIIEVNTTLKFQDKELNEKKSHFEIVYASIVRIADEVKDKKNLEKIILCDVQNEIYPKLKTLFVKLINDAGYPTVKFEKEIDFAKLYSEK